jgi:hypothetical protein
MELGVCWTWNLAKKIKHSSENQVIFWFFKYVLFFIFWTFELNNNNNHFIVVLFCTFVNKIIMFQEALQFHSTTVFCYNR